MICYDDTLIYKNVNGFSTKSFKTFSSFFPLPEYFGFELGFALIKFQSYWTAHNDFSVHFFHSIVAVIWVQKTNKAIAFGQLCFMIYNNTDIAKDL